MRPTRWIGAALGASLAWALVQPATAGCTLSYAPLAVTMEDGEALVDATIDGHPVRFLLATGSFFSTITPGSAKILGLASRGGRSLRLRAPGGEFDAVVVSAREVVIGGATLKNVEFLSGGGEMGPHVAGVMGQNFLHQHDVEYDLAHGVVRLVKAAGCGKDMIYWPAPRGFSALDLTVFGTDATATSTFVEIDGQKMKAKLSLGAPSYLTRAAARRLGFSPDGPGVQDAGMVHGAGPKLLHSWLMPVDSVVIGSETIQHTRLRVADTEGEDVDLLLGSDFFLSHHIYVSNSRRRILVTYNGGPVFDLRVASATPGPVEAPSSAKAAFPEEPTDADGFARRGAALTERKDAVHAISDLTRAVEMDPKSARYRYLRALAYRLNAQPYLAMADVEAALALSPDDADARVLRATLRDNGNDFAGARQDLDALDAALAPQDDHRYGMIWLYARGQFWDLATRQADLWIRSHPQDPHISVALNERCWIGAMANADLGPALEACNRAVEREPKNASYRDSRGLVRLRRGEVDQALADYDAALVLNPKLAWSLYGRSLAERRKGQTDKAEADLASALAVDPKMLEKARIAGLEAQP